ASFCRHGPVLATSRNSTCTGSSRLSGICTASTPPKGSAPSSRCNCLRWPGTHWKMALANSTSVFSGGAQCAMLASMNFCAGNRSRACRSMSAEVSIPITSACGQRFTSSSVELPGPQPISTTLRASAIGICASRSRDGRVRSSSNLRYCCGLQSAIATPLTASSAAPGLPRQLLVLDPVRNDGVLAEPAHLVPFIVLEIALEPFDMAVAFEGQDVGGDAVEEPAVMADDDSAAGKILQRLFQRAQRIDVEVVGRFVEQQHVG